MPPLAHLARCKKLWAEKEPSVKLPGGGKVCNKNTKTQTQIHMMHIRQFKHTSALAQTQTSSHRAQLWASEVWRSQVVPRAVSFRSNPVMSGKILPKSQKPRKTHFRTHNILAFRSPSPGKDEKKSHHWKQIMLLLHLLQEDLIFRNDILKCKNILVWFLSVGALNKHMK